MKIRLYALLAFALFVIILPFARCEIPNCYIYSQTNSSQCLECIAGYYLNGHGFCDKCLTGCRNCSNATVCTNCEWEYFLTENSTCEKCNSEGCIECYNAKECEQCTQGYFMNSKTCNQCMPHCWSCNDNSSCTHCQTEYYFDPWEALCSQCQPTVLRAHGMMTMLNLFVRAATLDTF